MKLPRFCSVVAFVVGAAALGLARPASAATQLTAGERNHFFGYIGQAGTIPWSGDGRYVLTLETSFHDRMPTAADAAGIGLVDMQPGAGRSITIVDRTRAWNFQQGTMFYWNPERPNTQFFFNDRDPATNRIFCVLYDAAERRRVREFRFDDTPIGNSGVAQNGGAFLAINYGRLARLRSVTGYPEAHDWTVGVEHPADDGVFKVDTATGRKTLLASFAKLAELLRGAGYKPDGVPLFINHTLWNRDGDRIFFFARGGWTDGAPQKINAPCVMQADGSNLKILKTFPGGHPEWDTGRRLIIADGDGLAAYDVDEDRIVERLGSGLTAPDGDKARSPKSRYIAVGARRDGWNLYEFVDLWHQNRVIRSPHRFNVTGHTSGDLRIDPAPCWNRDGDMILFTAPASNGTRQLFLMAVD